MIALRDLPTPPPDCPDVLEYQRRQSFTRWAKFREAYMAKIGWTCEWCGYRGGLVLHHLTYERFGAELEEDVVGLCGHCHTLAHHPKNKGLRWSFQRRKKENKRGISPHPPPDIGGGRANGPLARQPSSPSKEMEPFRAEPPYYSSQFSLVPQSSRSPQQAPGHPRAKSSRTAAPTSTTCGTRSASRPTP